MRSSDAELADSDDGRSPTLEHAVQDMIESTRQTTAPQDDVDAITAYLRTL